MAYPMYQIVKPLSNGMRPGEMRTLAEFAGCDLDWLEGDGAIVGMGSSVHGFLPAGLTVGQPDPAQLQAEIIRLQQQMMTMAMGQGMTQPVQPSPIKRFPTADTREERQQFAARVQAASHADDAGNRLKPVTHFPGQQARIPAGVPTAGDTAVVLQAIAQARDVVCEEIRRFATGDADDSELGQLRADLKASQEACADLQRQVAELSQQTPADNKTASGQTPTVPVERPRPSIVRPEKPIK